MCDSGEGPSIFFLTRRVPEMPRVAGRLRVDLPSMMVAAENRLDEAY